MSLRIGLIGSTGRMGSSISQLIISQGVYTLGKCFSRSSTYPLDEVVRNNDILIDVSSSELTMLLLEKLMVDPKPVILCTSGIDYYDQKIQIMLNTIAQSVPVAICPNVSFGATLQRYIVKKIASLIGPQYDIRLIETHHRKKKDALSGTAAALLADIQTETQKRVSIFGEVDRSIEVLSSRVGDVMGDHQVDFISEDDSISISHTVYNRSLFSKCVLQILDWLVSKSPHAKSYTTEEIWELI